MPVLIIPRTVGPLAMNAYLVGCEKTREAVAIDPGDDVPGLLAEVERVRLRVKYILNTHAHVDHVAFLRDFQEATGAPFYLHPAERIFVDRLDDPFVNFGMPVGEKPRVDGDLSEGLIFEVGELEIRVMETPGHSPGGVAFLVEDRAFVGDVLMAGGIGRWDLPLASPKALKKSLARLMTLLDGTKVYPGHGPPTTIGRERKTNLPMLELLAL